ncbi:EF-hand domain-containing protein [Desulfocurvibacter africanus]|uniref:EF-hand domain-containing protein n=1 Tax=Desulfocurvibacter africanus TaxID=873 RepID=UPI002FDB7F98
MISGIGGSTGYLSNMMSEMRRQQTKSASQMSEELFSKADANGDGTVDETELAKALSSQSKVGGGDGPSAEELFDFLDADGDGGITEQEHADGLQTLQDQLQGQQDSMAMMGMMGMMEMMGMKAPSDQDQTSGGLFSELDANGDGVIDETELASALGDSSSVDNEEESGVEELIAALDADGDGAISEDELDAGLKTLMEELESQRSGMAMQGMAPPPPPEQSQTDDELFSETDANGDGVIDADELASALESRQAEGGNGPSADELFAALDADGDGSITQQEHSDGLQAMRTQREAGGFSANLMASALQQYQTMSQGILGMQAMTQVSFFA